MIIEYAQIMSTAHRVLDGEEYYGRTKNGRRIKRWKMNSNLEDILYKASHVNHPSNQWVRSSWRNYTWLYEMWECLCNEYTYRYNKDVNTKRIESCVMFFLNHQEILPTNIGQNRIKQCLMM